MTTENKVKGRAKGGIARAKALTADQRKEIAMKGVEARRENSALPQATHEGIINLGGSEVSCAVLPDGLRVITQATFLRSLGRSRSPKAGTGVLSTVDDLPFFLQAESLKPFISNDLAVSTTPIFYRGVNGSKGVGYDARLLPQVAEVYLKFRDSMLANGKKIPTQYAHIINASDILMRGLAHIGIIALVDEATGYQKDRARDALAKILEAYVAKELQPYVRTFESTYYEHMFRLRGLPYPPDISSSKPQYRPQYFGKLTNDIVYSRLAPGVLEALKEEAKKEAKRTHLHRHLTAGYGRLELIKHLAIVTLLMKRAKDWQEFMIEINKEAPRYGDTYQIDIDEIDR